MVETEHPYAAKSCMACVGSSVGWVRWLGQVGSVVATLKKTGDGVVFFFFWGGFQPTCFCCPRVLG